MAEFQAHSMFAVPVRVAVITGGGSGLGRMVATSLYVNGASVTLVDMNQDRLNSVKEGLETMGRDLKLSGKINTCVNIPLHENVNNLV
jgi:NADP-dependent 3-hydroxy acid dehydrogenase YdfG